MAFIRNVAQTHVDGVIEHYQGTLERFNQLEHFLGRKYAATRGFVDLAKGAKTAADNHRLISTIIDPIQKSIDFGVDHATSRLFIWLQGAERYQRLQIYVAMRFFPTNDRLIALIQVTVRASARIHAVTERTSHYDRTEFSRCLTLLTGDVQELGGNICDVLGLPGKFRTFVHEAKEAALQAFYGSAQKPTDLTSYNSFGSLLKPVQWRESNRLIPKDDAKALLNGYSQTLLETTDQVEIGARIESFRKLSTKALEKGTFLIASQGIKYVVSDWTGYVLACTLYGAKNLSAQALYWMVAVEVTTIGEEEQQEELLPFTTFLTLYKTIKCALWVYLIHRELRTWRERREAAPEQMREAIHAIPNQVTTWTNEQLEKGAGGVTKVTESANQVVQSFLGRIAGYFLKKQPPLEEQPQPAQNDSWVGRTYSSLCDQWTGYWYPAPTPPQDGHEHTD